MTEGQPRRAPEVRMMDIVFPVDTNSIGTMFGGSVMARMDKAAILSAIRFDRGVYITISTDGLQFLAPINQGDIIECVGRVAFVGNTSLVAKVEVYRENHFSDETELCTKGWFAMASRSTDNKPRPLPRLLVETEQERLDWDEAKAFRDRSLQFRSRGRA